MKLSWEAFRHLCARLAFQVKTMQNEGLELVNVYGIPRGGCYVAQELSIFLCLPMCEPHNITNKTLIVDDICDSGKTLGKYLNHGKATLFAEFVYPDNVKGEGGFHVYVDKKAGWVEFPWEHGESHGEDAVIRMLQVIGENPHREGLQDTPKRVTKSWTRLFGGYGQDPKEILKTTFGEVDEYDQIVALTDIELYSTCEHHMLPFYGRAHVGYLPKGKVVGLSKLARLVEIFSRRLQIQERLTMQIANAIQEHLDPLGVGVIIQAKHFCMLARGVEKQNSEMTTSCMLGAFRDDAKDEFLKLCLK